MGHLRRPLGRGAGFGGDGAIGGHEPAHLRFRLGPYSPPSAAVAAKISDESPVIDGETPEGAFLEIVGLDEG